MSSAAVAEALDWLVQQRRIGCDRLAGGKLIFRAASSGGLLT